MCLGRNHAVTGTILVADDKVSNRELMDELLSQRDSGHHRVRWRRGFAADGQRPYRLGTAGCDHAHLNGFEPANRSRRIRDLPDPRHFGNIALRQTRSHRSIRVGADDFLSRPVDRTELLARYASLLKLKHRTDELERAESSCSRSHAVSKAKTPTRTATANVCRSILLLWERHLGLPAGSAHRTPARRRGP